MGWICRSEWIKDEEVDLQRSFTLLRNQVVIETDEPVLFDRLEDIVVCTEDRLPICGEIFLRLETEDGLIRVRQNGQTWSSKQIRSWLFGICTC